VPHWSRGEKSATTLGPAGRLALTAVTVLWGLGAAIGSPITLIFVLPVLLVVLHAIWQRGWVVPGGAGAATPPAEPMATWLWDRSEFVQTVALAVLAFVGVGVFLSSGNPIVRFVVIVTGVVFAGAWMFRKVGGSR
jgi:hypothetical protein